MSGATILKQGSARAAVPRGGILSPAPGAVVDPHPTYGLTLRSISGGGYRFACAATGAFAVEIDRASDHATIVASPADFNMSVETHDGAGTVLATWRTDPRIAFTFTFTVEGDEVLFGQALNSTSTTYSVKTFDWPRFDAKLFGAEENCYAAAAWQGGVVVPQPHLSPGVAVVAPLSMQFASMYDSRSRQQLYIATDDDEGCRKIIAFAGQTTSVRWLVRHEVDRRYVPGSDFTRPYRTHIAGITGRTWDGRLGYYDAADRYRMWATDAARPWMTRGPWKDAAHYSARVKNSDVLLWWPSDSVHRDFPRKTNIVSRLMSHAGLTNMIATPYWWVQQAFYAPAIDNPSIGTMQSDYLSFLASAQALGCHVQDYVNHRFLDSQLLSGPFNVSAYPVTGLGTIDVRTRCLRDKAGALTLVDSGTIEGVVMMQPDYARSDWALIAYQILFDYAVAHALAGSAGPRGIYYDSFGANLSDYQDDPTQSSWTYRANQAGRKNVIATILSGFRGVDPDFLMSQEYPEETMIDSFDLLYTMTLGGETVGKFVDLFSYVYGQMVRTAQYIGPQITDGNNNPAGNIVFEQLMNVSWLRSGIASINDSTTSAGAELIAASPSPVNTQLFYFFDWVRVIHAARPRTLPYHQGKRMPPLSINTWEPGWVDSVETVFQQYWVGVQVNNVVKSEIFLVDDEYLGIIVIHEYPAGVLGDPGPQTVTLELDASRYEIGSGEKALYERTDAGLVEIARFRNVLKQTLTIPNFTVKTYEVRVL